MNIVQRCICTTVLMSISLSAQPPLSFDEYEQQLLEYQSRDQKLREEIAHEQAVILDLKNQIELTRKNISTIHQKNIETLGITEKNIMEISEAIRKLQEDITLLQNLSDSQLQQDSLQFFSIKKRLTSLQSSPALRLRTISRQLNRVAELYKQCEHHFIKVSTSVEMAKRSEEGIKEKTVIESYTVQKINDHSETLFSIATQVYGDPLQWPKIYQANKEVIDRNFRRYRKDTNPSKFADPSDLIFPGQVLSIPR